MHDFSETIGKRVRLAQIWSLLAVGLLGLAVAIAAWTALSAWEERLARTKFNDTAGDYATVIQNGLDEHLDKIRALGAFFDASDTVDATEFTLFHGPNSPRLRRHHAALVVPARGPGRACQLRA